MYLHKHLCLRRKEAFDATVLPYLATARNHSFVLFLPFEPRTGRATNRPRTLPTALCCFPETKHPRTNRQILEVEQVLWPDHHFHCHISDPITDYDLSYD